MQEAGERDGKTFNCNIGFTKSEDICFSDGEKLVLWAASEDVETPRTIEWSFSRSVKTPSLLLSYYTFIAFRAMVNRLYKSK